MTKDSFLQALRNALSQLPASEIERHVGYYDEMLSDMMEDGMEETAAVAKLGDVSAIAEQILREVPLPLLVRTRMRPKAGWSAISILCLILGAPLWVPLLATFFVLVITFYLVIWTLIAVLFVVVLAITISGIALVLAAVLQFSAHLPEALFIFGCGLVCAGISIFAFFGAVAATKGLIRATFYVARGTKSLFIRKERQA